MSLDGRVALVTGGGRGIGRAVSLGLAADGARVAVNFRKDEESAKGTVAAIEAAGGSAAAYQASVASYEEDAAMVDQVLSDFGHVDILVNNAGITNRGTPVAKTEVEELERLMATMAFGSHHMSQLVLPSMREQPRGDIVMISSQSAVTTDPYGGPYNMAKAAQEALAFTLAKEEARSGIRVNVVVPGLANTDMGRRLVKAAMKVDDIHELNARFPLGRVCEPEDVADAVRFLVGDRRLEHHGATDRGRRRGIRPVVLSVAHSLHDPPHRSGKATSRTGRRRAGRRSLPRRWATGMSAAWVTFSGMPRSSAMAWCSSRWTVVIAEARPRLRNASWKLHTAG